MGAQAYKAPNAPWLAETVMEGTMEGPEAVQRATELIEQRLAQEEETEVGAEMKGVRGMEGEASRLMDRSICLSWEGKDWLLPGSRQHVISQGPAGSISTPGSS